MNQTSPHLNYPAVNALKELQTNVRFFLGVHIGVYQAQSITPFQKFER